MSNKLPIVRSNIAKSGFNFPTMYTEVGPSAPPTTETVSFSFIVIILPTPRNIEPIMPVSNIFFIISPSHQIMIYPVKKTGIFRSLFYTVKCYKFIPQFIIIIKLIKCILNYKIFPRTNCQCFIGCKIDCIISNSSI